MEKETKDMKTYEVGYLLAPIIPEEKLDEEISLLRKAIEDKNGMVVNEGRAKMQKLAYTISKKGLGRLNNAYFGWIRFMAPAVSAPEIKVTFDNNPNMVRFLITKPGKEENTKPARKPRKKPTDATAKTKAEDKVEVKNEEIDKKIEELIK